MVAWPAPTPCRGRPVLLRPVVAVIASSLSARGILSAGRAALLLATLALAAPRPLAAQASALDRILRDTVLANGLTVVVAENHAVPLATVEVAVRNGAFTQRETEAGTAHLFEHML